MGLLATLAHALTGGQGLRIVPPLLIHVRTKKMTALRSPSVLILDPERTIVHVTLATSLWVRFQGGTVLRYLSAQAAHASTTEPAWKARVPSMRASSNISVHVQLVGQAKIAVPTWTNALRNLAEMEHSA